MVSLFLVIYAGLLWLLTVALHALVAQPVQDGAALVADGGARLVVMLQPGVGRPGLVECTIDKYFSKLMHKNPCARIYFLFATLAVGDR